MLDLPRSSSLADGAGSGHAVDVQRLSILSELEAPVHLALGVFDGVHLGHQAVIARAVEAARESGGRSGVLTFDPYPLRVLAPEKAPRRLLASLDHKAQILAPLGVDFLLALPFDQQQAKVEAADFIENLVIAGARTLAAGEDWRFGCGREGGQGLLRRLGKQIGFRFEAVPPVMMEGDRISSTRIRQAIGDGNMTAAARMLGRAYSVAGRVVEGRKLGRRLGFATANLERGDEQYPPDGVWAVRGAIKGARCAGVANLGMKPTVDGTERSLEVHFFGEVGELYGEMIEVEFVEYLRGEQKFGSLEALKVQIGQDVAKAMYILRE